MNCGSRLWLLGALLMALTATADSFYALAADPAAGLPADKLYPAGRQLLFTGYSPRHSESLKAMHFTAIGAAYGGQVQQLREAALQLGLPLITSVNPEIDGQRIGVTYFDQKEVDQDALEASVRSQVREILERYSSHLAMWIVTPEELRSWRRHEMEYLRRATAAIRELDPLKRPIFMYEPNHRTAEGLAATGVFQDVMAKGMYVNAGGYAHARTWVRYSTEQMAKAREKLGRPEMLILAVPEMYQDPPPEDRPLIPEWVRHDVYLSLLCGARGVLIFSLAPRRNFSCHGAYLQAYSQVAAELNGEAGMAELLLFGKPCRDLQVTVTAGETDQVLSFNLSRSSTLMPTVQSYELLHSRGRFLFIVNSAESPVTVAVSGQPRDARILDALSQQPVTPGNLIIKPYAVLILKVLPPEK